MTAGWRCLYLAGLAVCLLEADSGRPALVDAARNGDRDALRALLQKKVDVNAAEGDGATALHWASYRDDVESADLLIRTGAKVNLTNDLGATPLWAACQNGSAAMVGRLLAAGANPNAALLAGETPLMVAARSGYPDIVELLLGKGANVNAHAARGQTALMWAVAQKHPEVVKVLLAHSADVHARSEVWNEVMAVPPHGYPDYNRAIPHGGDTALMFAARVGDLNAAKLLVAAGSNVNDQDAWGVSATVLAAHSGYRELVGFLLDKGADPSSAAAGFTALHEAIMRRDEKMASLLLDHGADPNTPLRTWTPTRRSSRDFHFDPALVGATPFWLAARFSQPSVMRLLLKHGADPRFVHHSDYVTEGRYQHRTEVTTALMAATGMGGGGTAWIQPARSEREALTLEAVKLAAELGVDLNAANTDGRTALDAAKDLRYSTVVKFLVEKGAKSGRPAQQDAQR
ncbi:MAG TPA: ankyrin repeat domain-containing protein [Bryobacteraceae bacterium]|nr:ankyrin repeat domain-containing protein [Bryobacteraceae bacterium]